MLSKLAFALAMVSVTFLTPVDAAQTKEKKAKAPRSVASDDPVYVVARMHFKPAAKPMADLFGSLARGLPRDVKKEEGCIEYRFYRSKKNPGDFISVEKWASEELFDKHMKSLKMRGFVAVMGPFMKAKPEMILHHPILAQANGSTDDASLGNAVVAIRRIKPKAGTDLDAKMAEVQSQAQGRALQYNVFKGFKYYPGTEPTAQYNIVGFWRSEDDFAEHEKTSALSGIADQIEAVNENVIFEPVD